MLLALKLLILKLWVLVTRKNQLKNYKNFQVVCFSNFYVKTWFNFFSSALSSADLNPLSQQGGIQCIFLR
jgi:hypothetical protein